MRRFTACSLRTQAAAGDIIFPMNREIPAEVRPLFWDVEAEGIDLVRNAEIG